LTHRDRHDDEVFVEGPHLFDAEQLEMQRALGERHERIERGLGRDAEVAKRTRLSQGASDEHLAVPLQRDLGIALAGRRAREAEMREAQPLTAQAEGEDRAFWFRALLILIHAIATG